MERGKIKVIMCIDKIGYLFVNYCYYVVLFLVFVIFDGKIIFVCNGFFLFWVIVGIINLLFVIVIWGGRWWFEVFVVFVGVVIFGDWVIVNEELLLLIKLVILFGWLIFCGWIIWWERGIDVFLLLILDWFCWFCGSS